MNKIILIIILMISVLLVSCSSFTWTFLPSESNEEAKTSSYSAAGSKQENTQSNSTVSTGSKQVVQTSYAEPKNKYKKIDSYGYDVEGEDLYALAEVLYASDEIYGSYRLFGLIGTTPQTPSYSSETNVFAKYEKKWTKINIGLTVFFDFEVDPEMYVYFLKEYIPGEYGPIPLGSKGPAGGYVFYDKGYYSDGWRFLELAPNDITDNPIIGYFHNYASSSYYHFNLDDTTSYDIGYGHFNTNLIITCMESSKYKWNNNKGVKTDMYAAKLCDEYVLNGYDDWFLPSTNELSMVYHILYLNGIGGMSETYYWSSSVDGNAAIEYERAYSMHNFDWGGGSDRCNVRPIRAF